MQLARIGTCTTAVLVATWFTVVPARAQDQAAPDEPAAHEAHGEEHARNALGLILGATYESEEKHTFFTVGVEYERLFSPRFAVVLGVEYITEVDALVAVLPFVYRHGSGWRLLAGPGLELKTRRPELEREHEGGPGIAEDIVDRLPGEEENLFLWRFGAAYNFKVGERYAIAPHVDLDFVREDGHWVEAVVFSVTIGFDF